jgi:hypothetical protein
VSYGLELRVVNAVSAIGELRLWWQDTVAGETIRELRTVDLGRAVGAIDNTEDNCVAKAAAAPSQVPGANTCAAG